MIIKINLLKVNNDQVKEMESHVTMNNIQCMEFNELKINLCKNLNIKPIIITKIEQAQTVNELLEIMKISLKSQDDIFNALKTITIWASKNSKNDLNNICKKNFIQTKKTEENIGQIKNLNISTENDLSAYSDLSTSQMIKVKSWNDIF